MALWPLSELISSLNGKKALRTELTGRNIEVLKQYVNDEYYLGREDFMRWGDNATKTGANLRPVDVSRYARRLIYIKNNYNAEFSTLRIGIYDRPRSLNEGGILIYEEDIAPLPSGGEIIINQDNLPIINDVFGGLSVLSLATTTEPTKGSHTILFLGGN